MDHHRYSPTVKCRRMIMALIVSSTLLLLLLLQLIIAVMSGFLHGGATFISILNCCARSAAISDHPHPHPHPAAHALQDYYDVQITSAADHKPGLTNHQRRQLQSHEDDDDDDDDDDDRHHHHHHHHHRQQLQHHPKKDRRFNIHGLDHHRRAGPDEDRRRASKYVSDRRRHGDEEEDDDDDDSRVILDQLLRRREADRIVKLPGQPSDVGFHQFSGYVAISEAKELFYWLTEAPHRSSDHHHKLPLILWLNGGPGCSSLAYGAMEEIGPFRIFPNASRLYLSEHSWNKVANLLFLESPVGVGFSYTNRLSELSSFGDQQTADDAHSFLIKWFERFPQYKGRDFYIMGESYAGHYIPQLAKLVYERNVKGVESPEINLKGVMVGNGVLDFYYDNMGLIEYWWDHALISDSTYNALHVHCDFHTQNVSNMCNQLLEDAFNKEMVDIDLYSIYTPVCKKTGQSQRLASRRSKGNPLLRQRAGYDPCLENYAEVYFNRPDVQKALHANSTGIPYRWTACSDVLFQNWKDSAFSVIPLYKELISARLKIWLFSGDVDAVVPVTGTRYGVEHMNLRKKEDWFSWYVKGQVGGRCQAYDGISLVTIRNAGHEVPYTQPERGFVLVKSFLASGDEPLLPRNNTELSSG